MLVNNIDFCWEKRAVLHSGEVLKSRILGEEGALPGRLGEDVGEIQESGKFQKLIVLNLLKNDKLLSILFVWYWEKMYFCISKINK